MKPQNHNSLAVAHNMIMYIDMNSFFASCEQHFDARYIGKPIGVCPYEGPNAVVIAASKEAKQFGIKTGMKFSECLLLCPTFQMVASRPVKYRQIHVQIMNILKSYFSAKDIIPKSIDEAAINLTPYLYVYKELMQLAKNIKLDIATKIGKCITCSIGIAGNSFLAKLATEIQKPNGLVFINADNIDAHLANMKLTDIPGIARANERRLRQAGIYTPLQMRYASEILLRKVFGGVTGNYWYYRLHFKEVDLYTSDYKHMSAMRSLSKKNRTGENTLLSLLISLCTRLEQRLVKQGVFCKMLSFHASYYSKPSWKAVIKLNEPLQDAMEMLHHIQARIKDYEKQCAAKIMISDMSSMGVLVGDLINKKEYQYSLFDNRMQKDLLRTTIYTLKDKYGKNMVRKASETIEAGQMKDAIGFGSVKDMYQSDDVGFNKFLLEDDPEMAGFMPKAR